MSSTRTKKINFVETPARGRPWPENGPKRHRQIKKEKNKKNKRRRTEQNYQ